MNSLLVPCRPGNTFIKHAESPSVSPAVAQRIDKQGEGR